MTGLPTILVTGSRGQVGTEIGLLAEAYKQYQFIFFDRSEWPIDDLERSRAIFEKYQPQYLINCAAYTAVDKAETDREAAFAINATAPGQLAGLCQEYRTRMIHISTDYVFNGEVNRPLKEDDPVQPVNYYGETKLTGEEAVINNLSASVILRTSWVYASHGKNFVLTMLRLMKERESINVVSDQHGSPTYAADLAAVILQIISSDKWVPGIFHFSNEGFISWFNFAEEIRKLAGLNCKVNPITTAQYPTPAKRPMFSMMDKSKIVRTYGIKLRNWRESLYECLSKVG